MPRLTLFAKGNSDVFDPIFACADRSASWNGLNEALRDRGSDWRVRIRHEVWTRSDALLVAQGRIPPALAHLTIAPPYDLPSQFSTAVFDTESNAILLSIASDVCVTLVRHRASGEVFDLGPASDALRPWVRAECDFVPLITPEQSLENMTTIVTRLRQRSQAPILVCNMSTVVPGETVDDYQGLGEILSTRIKRFNLGLIELSARAGVVVVDVDRIAARQGAEGLLLDGTRLNCQGCRLVGAEIVRLLDDHGCFRATGR